MAPSNFLQSKLFHGQIRSLARTKKSPSATIAAESAATATAAGKERRQSDAKHRTNETAAQGMKMQLASVGNLTSPKSQCCSW